MNNIEVLCAVDVNDFDQDVVDLAAHFAQLYRCDLDLLHVTNSTDPTEFPWQGYTGPSKSLVQDNRRLRDVTTTVAGVNVHHHHLAGTPSEKIIDFANSQTPRILVIGTHGRSGLERIFGSVAAKVMRSVDCPVLVLRQKRNEHVVANGSG